MALKTWLDLLRDDPPRLTLWVRPLADPTLDADYWNALRREHPSLLDGLTYIPLECEVTPLDGEWAAAVVEVVPFRVIVPPRAA